METNSTAESDAIVVTPANVQTAALAEESLFVMKWSEFLTYYHARATWEIISGWARGAYTIDATNGPRPQLDETDSLGGLAPRRECFTCGRSALSIVKVVREGKKTTICAYCRSRMAIRLGQLAIWNRVFVDVSRAPFAKDIIAYLRQLVVRAVLCEFAGEIVPDIADKCIYS